jgi:myo-inositol catabolism protein IolC
MTVGYDRPLYILAFDHRGTLQRGLAALPGGLVDVHTRVTEAKIVIYDGFRAAVTAGVPGDQAGILVDEEFGAAIARTAVARGELVAVAVEKSGGEELALRLVSRLRWSETGCTV